MAESTSIENFYDFLEAHCGTPPSRYEEANCCKKKGCACGTAPGGQQKCVGRTAKPAATAAAAAVAKGCNSGRQAKTDAKPSSRLAKPDATTVKKRPPSPWAPVAQEECADDVTAAACRPPPSRCSWEDRCACPRRRPPLPTATTTITTAAAAGAAVKRRARKCASGCDDDDHDDDDDDDDGCGCRRRRRRCSDRPSPPSPSPVAARRVRWYDGAIGWVRCRAWNVVLGAVAFFAGMCFNDYCRCVYDDDS